MIMLIDQKFQEFLQTYQHKSHSELRQEQFVLFVLNNKQNGFFVEFGAMDGVRASNTYMLEKVHGWTGILSEPNPRHHDLLKRNRNCVIDFRCVSDRTGVRVQFQTASVRGYPGMVGHIYRESRSQGDVIEVETLSLNDLLLQNQAPSEIDYISVDTDGSEPLIMKSFDFGQHRVSVWTIEHNQEPWRQDIKDLMESNGYCRVAESQSRYDDWYVHQDILEELEQ
jgi:FkbM family methyltransferase